MTDMDRPEQGPEKKRSFIREKIVKPPLTKRQVALRFLAYLFLALLGGTAAGVGFAVARPLAETYFVPRETQESIPVTIPKDETETPAPTQETTEPPSETETLPEESEETEAVEDVVQEVIESYEYTPGDVNRLYGALLGVAQEADNGIVTVHSVKQEVDWFDNPVETSGLYAGAVIASTSQELLVLTPIEAVEKADSIKVAFNDSQEVGGAVKGSDEISGIAVVSVDVSELPESTREQVKVLELGNSYSVKRGDLAVAVGAPSGMVHSSAYGVVSYVMRNVQVADGITRLLYTDITGNAATGTFLLNIDGEIIGWVTADYQSDGGAEMTAAMAISDYKSMLEKLSNGLKVPYLGIQGQEVSAAMAEGGLPLGVYITNVTTDGPAYNAGIQNGDVVEKMGEKIISTIKDYENQLETFQEGDVVKVVVRRKSIDEYKQLEFEVTVGAR